MASSRLPIQLPRPGQPFAGLVIEQELARGGGGAVFIAAAPNGTRYAVKILLGERRGDRLERFRREVEIGATLKHPGLVEVVASGEEHARPYLVMELLEGAVPLDRYVEERNLPARESVRLIMEAALAVSAAHQVEIIHRDLKPDNILVTPAGQVKVVDFGIARQADREGLTKTGVMLGTLHYMSPEQVSGQSKHADERADVYALGATPFRLVTGDVPFVGDSGIEVMAAIMQEPVPDVAQFATVPTGLSEVIQLAMAKSADDRYPNAGEFARDLAAICSGSGTEASSRVQELLHSQRRGAHAKVLIAVLSVVALALAGGVIAFKRWKGVDPEVARRQAVSLNKEAWALLAKGGTLVSDADSIGKLVKRLEDLRGGGSKTEGRARERVLGLSGLLALAEGDAEAAARCLVGDNAPTQVALQGALAAVARDGDPVLGQRQLSRAIGRGMKRAELFGWRAHAAVRCGLKTRAQGDLALADLKILEHARGELTPKELGLRAKAFVATERFDLARDAVDAGAEPGQELRWDVAFGRAGLALDTSPKAALDAFKGLGPPGPADARCEATASAACERILRLLKSVGAGDATPSQCEILIAWAELAKRLRPEAPLPPRVKERLLLEATSLKHVQAGEIDLAVALAEVVPNDPEVQVAVARLGPVAWRRATKPERLLPAMRIGMRVAPDLDKRTLLKALVFHSLNDLHDLNPSDAYRDEALLLAKEVLSVTEDPIERGLVLWRRAALLSRLGDHDGAIVDARQAVELDASDERYHHRLALCYRSAGRVDDFVVAVGELTPRAAGADLHGRTLRLNWDIYRLHGRPVAARKGLEHLMKEVPVHAGWWVRLARVQLEVGDTVAALASLASARSHGASSKHLGAQRGPLLALTARAASAETVELAGLNTLIKALDVIRGNASLP